MKNSYHERIFKSFLTLFTQKGMLSSIKYKEVSFKSNLQISIKNKFNINKYFPLSSNSLLIYHNHI